MPVGIWAASPLLVGAGQASGQMSTYQRVMKYIYTQIHAHMDGTCVAIYCQAHKQQRHPLAAAFCRAPAWYMNYADARGQEECVCVCVCIGVCVGVCTALCMCVCVCLCLIYYILAFWQIAKRSSRFRTNFRVLLLFRHRCRCRCHSLILVPVVLVVILIVLMPIIIVVVCSTKSQKQITHHINGQWRCFLYMPCTGILINRLVLHYSPSLHSPLLPLSLSSFPVFISLSIRHQKTLMTIALVLRPLLLLMSFTCDLKAESILSKSFTS